MCIIYQSLWQGVSVPAARSVLSGRPPCPRPCVRRRTALAGSSRMQRPPVDSRILLHGDQFTVVGGSRASATLGRSQDVCKGARSPVEGERCVVGGWSLFKRLEANEEAGKQNRTRGLVTYANTPCHNGTLSCIVSCSVSCTYVGDEKDVGRERVGRTCFAQPGSCLHETPRCRTST